MSTATALKASVATMRNRLKIDEAEARRSSAAYLSAGILGLMEKPRQGDSAEEREPLIEKIPTFFGLPRLAGIAIVAKVGAQYAGGSNEDYLNGLGDAAAVLAIHAFSKGEQVAGVADVGRRRSRSGGGTTDARIRALEEKLRRQLAAAGGGTDDDLDAQIADLVAAAADDE